MTHHLTHEDYRRDVVGHLIRMHLDIGTMPAPVNAEHAISIAFTQSPRLSPYALAREIETRLYAYHKKFTLGE